MQKQKKKERNIAIAKSVAKGTSVAAGVSIAAIVLLALGLKVFNVPEEYITIINQVLKAASIVIGTIFGVGAGGQMGYVKGAAIGGSYMALGLGASMILSAAWLTPLSIVADLALGGAVGAIGGAVTANMSPKVSKKKTKALA